MIDGWTDWALLCLAALCVGLGKAGFSGIGLIPVAIMAELFVEKSVGVLLPMLIVADLAVYPLFRKYGSWHPVWKLLPPALAGIAVGYVVLQHLPQEAFKPLIGSLILLMVLIQLGRKLSAESFALFAHSRSFGLGAGVFAGFATMVANAAGPVFQLYLISKRMPKMELIGIGARFFLLINILKLPLTAKLDFTTPESVLINLKLAPLILLGVFCGKSLLKLISQRVFEWMVIGFAVLAGGRLITSVVFGSG